MLQSKHAGNKFIHFVRDAMMHIIFDDILEKIASSPWSVHITYIMGILYRKKVRGIKHHK